MVIVADIAGSGLDSVIVPRTANLISVRRPGRLRLALVIAARSEPGPALARLVTVSGEAVARGGRGGRRPAQGASGRAPQDARGREAQRPGSARARVPVTILNTIILLPLMASSRNMRRQIARQTPEYLSGNSPG